MSTRTDRVIVIQSSRFGSLVADSILDICGVKVDIDYTFLPFFMEDEVKAHYSPGPQLFLTSNLPTGEYASGVAMKIKAINPKAIVLSLSSFPCTIAKNSGLDGEIPRLKMRQGFVAELVLAFHAGASKEAILLMVSECCTQRLSLLA